MPVRACGPWNLWCAACNEAIFVDLGGLKWSYKDSFEPSMVVLTTYGAEVGCPGCGATLPLQLEFSSAGGDFADPVLLVGDRRLRPVQASCDGHEYWTELDHQMSAEDFAYLREERWPDLGFYEGDRLLCRLPDPGQLYLAGPARLYLRASGHWWQSRNGGADWIQLEDFLDGWLSSQVRFWKQVPQC